MSNYEMQFRKLSSPEEEVVYVPDAQLQRKLNEQELKSTYGIGYSLLIKKGFKEGGTLGLSNRGLTEPIRVTSKTSKYSLTAEELRSQQPTKKHRSESASQLKLSKDETYQAVSLVVETVKRNKDQMTLWDLRNAIQSSRQHIPRRLFTLLSDLTLLRAVIVNQPVLLEVGCSDLVRLHRPPYNGFICECGMTFASVNVWIDHIFLTLDYHHSYKASLNEMRSGSEVFCLVCPASFPTALQLVYHSVNLHMSFGKALIYGLLWDSGLHSVEFLTALFTRDNHFDWSKFVTQITVSPRSVIYVSSDDEIEEIIDIG